MDTVLIVVAVLLIAMIAWFLKGRLARAEQRPWRSEGDRKRQQRTRSQLDLSERRHGGETSGDPYAQVFENGDYHSVDEIELYAKLQPYQALRQEHASLIAGVAEAYENDTPTETLMHDAERVAPQIKREEEALTKLYIETEFSDKTEATRFETVVFELSGALDDFVFNVDWLRGFMDERENN